MITDLFLPIYELIMEGNIFSLVSILLVVVLAFLNPTQKSIHRLGLLLVYYLIILGIYSFVEFTFLVDNSTWFYGLENAMRVIGLAVVMIIVLFINVLADWISKPSKRERRNKD